MKLSCLPVSIFSDIISGKMTIEEWVKAAVDIGFDGVDMSVLFFPNRTRRLLEDTKRILTHHNMAVTMITTYPDFTNPNVTQRERELLYLYADIALASEIGAEYLRITAGQMYPDANIDKTVEIVADYFRRSDKMASEFGVKLVYENHATPGAWDMPDFTFDPVAFVKLTYTLRDSNIKVNFDTANTFGYGGDAFAVFKEVFHSVETIHVADMLCHGKLDYAQIGLGNAPVREIIAYAKKHGFDGWLCIEECSNRGLDGIRHAANTVRQIWDTI